MAKMQMAVSIRLQEVKGYVREHSMQTSMTQSRTKRATAYPKFWESQTERKKAIRQMVRGFIVWEEGLRR